MKKVAWCHQTFKFQHSLSAVTLGIYLGGLNNCCQLQTYVAISKYKQFIIYLSRVLCLCVCVCVCVTICVGTLCYSFSFINQTDQGEEREGFKREGLKRER
jgi:hypothetical protein